MAKISLNQWWNPALFTCCLLSIVLASCGRPGEDDTDSGTLPHGRQDTGKDAAPANQEIELPFDGTAPYMVAGPDGTMHLLFRVLEGQSAKLYYSRKPYDSATWTTPVYVENSANAAYRWYCWPRMAVGQDKRVHFAWSPEARRSNGLYYESCMECTGNDWTNFRKVSGSYTEYFDICVTAGNQVHIVANHPYQEVDYFSPDGGTNFAPGNLFIEQGYKEPVLRTLGDDVYFLGRFRTLVFAKYSEDKPGAGRHWHILSGNVHHLGFGVGEMNPILDANGLKTFIYGIWTYQQGPQAIIEGDLEGNSTLLSQRNDIAYRPNQLQADVTKQGHKALIFADIDAYFHTSLWDGTQWSGDGPLNDKVHALDPNDGLATVAMYSHGGNGIVGWGPKIITPATTMKQSRGSFHIIFRHGTDFDASGIPTRGALHYLRYVPFPADEQTSATSQP